MTEETNLRQKVLKASVALIEAGGLDRLSMREAARKAGVSHQAPYHHFGDREAILAAIATEGFGMLQQELSRSLDKHAASQRPRSRPSPRPMSISRSAIPDISG